ncbi:MAG TPA: ABC transporter substrate-binding protein [Azospirillaceae bacterium]|nr:ABC transporter substrate-binding protein [Azospirillaceae bacterium]
MLTRRLLILCTALLAIGGWAVPSRAQGNPQAVEAAKFVDTLGSKAIETITSGPTAKDAVTERFREILNQGFDVPFIAQFVLGRYWNLATPEQQKEYLKLFEQMIVTTYTDRFRQYSGEQFQVAGARPEGDSDFFVQSQIQRPNGPPVNVEWRVRKGTKAFKIIDVVVEGVSMSVTQRSEFASVIQSQGGIDGLLKAMRQRAGAS